MRLSLISFTRQGGLLCQTLFYGFLREGHSCEAFCMPKYAEECGLAPLEEPLGEWCGRRFSQADALIFVGACGIAVRGIAPFVKDKREDPAVVVVDEKANFVISLLSGHIGGANELTLKIAGMTGAQPVVTTATDVNSLFAVDVFARQNGMVIESMAYAKKISAALLDREPVGFYSDFPVEGEIPPELVWDVEIVNETDDTAAVVTDTECASEEQSNANVPQVAKIEKSLVRTKNAGIDRKEGQTAQSPVWRKGGNRRQEALGIAVTLYETTEPWPMTLHLYPRIVTVGIGCRKDTPEERIEEKVLEVLEKHRIPVCCICQAASIDLKKEEPGLLAFCRKYGIPYRTYSGEELRAVQGDFSPSAFVASVTGVDNVCERAAVLAAEQGTLIQNKYAGDGVTIALAVKKWSVRFE